MSNPTKPGASVFNSPHGNDEMNKDIQELIPWLREKWENAAKLWCAFSNVTWKKGEIEFGVTFRGAGAYVGELYMGTKEYKKDSFNYLEFYCSGTSGVVDPHIFEYLTKRGWKPYAYENDEDVEITEPGVPGISERDPGHDKKAAT